MSSAELRREALEVAVIPENPLGPRAADIQRAELAPGSSLLGCVGVSGTLELWDPADREAKPVQVEGRFRHLQWEEGGVYSSFPRSNSRLLAVSSQFDLKLLEVSVRPGSVSVLRVGEYSAENLLQAIKKDHSVSEFQSLHVLSWISGLCCVLINSEWILQLQWQQTEEEPEIVSCLRIQQNVRESQTPVHHCVCRGALFTITTNGLISVYALSDGSLLASVDLPLYLDSGLEDDDLSSSPPPSLSPPASYVLLQVSYDLSTAVALTDTNTATAIDLNHYFRVYPGHLLCSRSPERPSLQPPDARDQDSVTCSKHCLSALGLAFSTECSWESRLASMYSAARDSPPPPSSSSALWWSSLPHFSSHHASLPDQSRVSPRGLTLSFTVPDACSPHLLIVSEFSALLTFIAPGKAQTTVALWEFESRKVSYHTAEGEAAPVQRCGEKQHVLLLKSSGLFQVLFSVSQQDLLSRLMLFGRAATVDAVCNLNNWGRCSIPIHSLEAGLKNRQLDTVDFYLKSKENVLSPSEQPTGFSASLTERVQQLCPALDLLCSSVRDSNSEAQSRQFSEQLLHITLSFLHSQIRALLSDQNSDGADVQSCVEVLDQYLTHLRGFMKRFPWSSSGSGCRREESTADEWDQLPTPELVRASVLTNQIPRAQAVLRRRGQSEHRLADVRREGLGQVYSSLQQRDLGTANALLINMVVLLISHKKKCVKDLNVYKGMIILFQVEELLRRNYFTEEESKSLSFIREMERLGSLPVTQCPLKTPTPRALHMVHTAETSEDVLKDLVVHRRFEDSGLWVNVRLDWVKNWEQRNQTEILLSRLKHTEMTSCDASVLWRYLTSLHAEQRVVEWVQSDGAPQWPELTPELVNHSTACSTFMKEDILDRLARDSLMQLLKLCEDPNLVGTKLLEHVTSVPLRDLNCIVELLIVAHDCFSLTCHMEGIVRVLQAARHLSHSHLASGEHYGLLVRLLTGIGRYNEMTYIFDLLHQNHRFEMLLRKKMDTDRGQSSSLKTALLDYLKRCLPGDSEKHNMVALCFSMRREIGENHEMAARTLLKMIESQDWVVTPDLKSSLEKVQGLLKDAAESYAKDSCVRQATRCVKMAKLVALQLHFIKQGPDLKIINLKPAELLRAAIALPRCYQVFVLSEAYSYSPDWAEVLFQRVVLKGDFVYLEEFKRHRPLSTALSSSANVKKLLSHCEDVYSRYKLAYEQKLFDITQALLQDKSTAGYLHDRMAR
ncbi:hypothetical protein NQD34_004020 [Periophthalmus magnuspinnatus]|nr:hypothetical protein NQD34_004020 [Periophthalmus magnuspinnatus]